MKPLRGLLIVALCLILFVVSCDQNGGSSPDAGLYHTYAETGTALTAMADNFPNLTQLITIGQSVEGRDLWALKISDNADHDEAEPVVVLLGAHHAREWISVEVPLLIGDYLLQNYVNNEDITETINEAEIWIVPMVNPDGHQYSVDHDRLWRKNRRNNGDGTYGVDLNRNYGYKWGGHGSSGDTFSETYRGPSPFSEPETQAVRDFLSQIEPAALISYHSYSQLILYPWGYTNDAAPDKILMHELAVSMAAKIRQVNSIIYEPGQASTLYISSGDTADWLYALFAVPTYTVELRPNNRFPGFELPESQIQPTFDENLPAALYLIEWVLSD